MAEMNVPQGGGKKGHKKARSKKMSTRVDLTAMVDLGFLLITFFMLATTFNKPKTMAIMTKSIGMYHLMLLILRPKYP